MQIKNKEFSLNSDNNASNKKKGIFWYFLKLKIILLI